MNKTFSDDKCPQCRLVLDAEWPPSVKSLAKAMRGHRVEPIEFIARGGMGAVYKGRQCNLNGIVALKVMPPHAAYGSSIIQRFHRFKREARLLKQLNHPNVVTVYDFELAGNFVYFTMDFVDGLTLREMLNKSGPLSPSYAFKLFLQLSDALHYAHQSGVIHRDIKPENLLVNKEGGDLKIADFGLAKLNDRGASNEWQTLEGQRVGTLDYMAPEQVKNQAVDHRADIYSAGLVLYEMLTGKPPLGLFPPPPSEKAKVNRSLNVVLFRALENDVARRYQNMREFQLAVIAAMCWPETYRNAA